MSTFNVVVYCEDKKIKVKIEELFLKCEEIEPRFERLRKTTDNNSIIMQSLRNIEKNKIEQNEREFFAPLASGLSRRYPKVIESFVSCKTAIYELPTHLDDLTSFVSDVNNVYPGFSGSSIGNQSIDALLKDNPGMGVLDFFDGLGELQGAKGYVQKNNPFLGHLSKLTDTPLAYQQSLERIKQLLDFDLYQVRFCYEFVNNTNLHYDLSKAVDNIEKNNDPFNNKIKIIALNLIIAGHEPARLLDSSISDLEKESLIKYLYANIEKQLDLSLLLDIVNSQAIHKLYKACIGKQVTEETVDVYTWSYTEWHFLKNAKFKLRPDGRMSISELEKNAEYCKIYAVGARLHSVFEKEMRNLGKLIGLEFADDCDFHKEIIFTEKCTQELIAKGLHYNSSYLDKYLAKLAVTQSPNAFFPASQPTLPTIEQSKAAVANTI